MSKVSHPFDSWSMPDRVLNNTGKPGVTVTAYRDSVVEEELVAAAKGGDEAAFEEVRREICLIHLVDADRHQPSVDVAMSAPRAARGANR